MAISFSGQTWTSLLNYGLFQAGWFVCVLGAAAGYPWLAAAAGLLLVLVHLALVRNAAHESLLLLASLLLGLLVDGVHIRTGVLVFPIGSFHPRPAAGLDSRPLAPVRHEPPLLAGLANRPIFPWRVAGECFRCPGLLGRGQVRRRRLWRRTGPQSGADRPELGPDHAHIAQNFHAHSAKKRHAYLSLFSGKIEILPLFGKENGIGR